jgi:hypothetical protein
VTYSPPVASASRRQGRALDVADAENGHIVLARGVHDIVVKIGGIVGQSVGQQKQRTALSRVVTQEPYRFQSASVKLGRLAARGQLPQHIADAVGAGRQRRVKLHLVGEAGESVVLMGGGRVQQSQQMVPGGDRCHRQLGVADVYQEHDGAGTGLGGVGRYPGRGQLAARQARRYLLRFRRRETAVITHQPAALHLPAGQLHAIAVDVIVVRGNGAGPQEHGCAGGAHALSPRAIGRRHDRSGIHKCCSSRSTRGGPGASIQRDPRGCHWRLS